MASLPVLSFEFYRKLCGRAFYSLSLRERKITFLFTK
jgi:hypothetical protein